MILFSHPGDFTPVCTTEMIAFTRANTYFKNLNTALLGLSIDSNASTPANWTLGEPVIMPMPKTYPQFYVNIKKNS